VEGYPDGTFKGQQNMTRYEMAQIIARMLAKEDQYNAEQRAMIDRLASEYADELNNLGVRVSALEKKVGNVRFTGDARMRYYQNYMSTTDHSTEDVITTTNYKKTSDTWDGRIRLAMKANVNDNTYVYGRFRTNFNFTDGATQNTYMDQLYAHSDFGAFGLTLGRSAMQLGNTYIFMDDYFDGVRASFGGKDGSLEGGYGRFKGWNNSAFVKSTDITLSTVNGDPYYTKSNNYANPEAWFVRAKGTFGDAFTLGADYIKLSHDYATYWGANANIQAGPVAIFGDYYKNTEANNDPYFYTAGLSLGTTDYSKPGTFRIGAQYVKNEKGAYIAGTTLHVSGALSRTQDSKFWLGNADVILMKNVLLHGEYAFNVKMNDQDADDLAAVTLNYIF
jgi:hypothetical protein